MGFTNEVVIGSLLNSRAVTPTAHIGSLPLTTFIYILTGALVFLICLFPLVTFLATFKTRFTYHAVASNDEKDRLPNFRQSLRRGPGYMESLARTAVDKNPLQPTNHVPPPIYNLPLPIGDAIVLQPDKVAELVSIDDLYDLQELLAEKKRVDITIHNLKRVVAASGRTFNPAVITRLQAATRRKEQLVTSIDHSIKKLRDHRASWTEEEWSLIELILQAYGRRI